ncbi:Gfo/Idh/MocA family protein [Rhizobium sophoriradicis]|uniref:Oxidoreductase n=1 Tax=Rhizobium sophoriradicis TaxID=1535245 RepID=A0A2A5KV73_9HYPH|nr:Gfo/Idh/MocA family oxidoreductase [Rhizobium sophoriradicis]PCK80976.1 oxidoreductase [Rhizobium sophoriradicis]
MANISIGVIGAGLIGRKHIKKAIEHPDFELAGIADLDRDAVSAQYPGIAVFGDYRSLLDQARPQAVIIASPNQSHASIGIECARLGIDMLIEKPVTDTLESAADLLLEVRANKVRTLVGHHRRHHDQVKTLRRLLGDGLIGNLVGVSAIWAAYKPDDYFRIAPWRTQSGGGPILINLIHEIDFLRYTAGEIRGVSAISSSRQRQFPVEDTAGALLEFDAGCIGTVFASDSAVSPWTTEQGVGEAAEFPFSGESSYRFVGSRGSLEFPSLVHWAQADGGQNWNRPIQSQRLFASSIDPYRAQLDHFRDVVLGKAESLLTVEDGARTLIATLAVAEAAASGRRIDLDDRYEALAAGKYPPASQDTNPRKAS